MLARPLTTAFIIAILGVLGLTSCAPAAPAARQISLDFPHGDLRLRVERDGPALLFYAAHPGQQAIADGTFDLDTLLAELQPRLHPMATSDKRPPEQPYGLVTVTFADGSSTGYLLYDAGYANALLQQACAQRSNSGPVHAVLVDRACEHRFTRP